MVLTNSSGVAVETYRYTAFGRMSVYEGDALTERTAGTDYGNPYGYTGRRWDEQTELWYYRAREYHPALGRFLQRDPVGYVDGVNLYAYVANNPLAYVDPSGTTSRLMSGLGSDDFSFGSSFGSSFAPVYDYGKTSLSGFARSVGNLSPARSSSPSPSPSFGNVEAPGSANPSTARYGLNGATPQQGPKLKVTHSESSLPTGKTWSKWHTKWDKRELTGELRVKRNGVWGVHRTYLHSWGNIAQFELGAMGDGRARYEYTWEPDSSAAAAAGAWSRVPSHAVNALATCNRVEGAIKVGAGVLEGAAFVGLAAAPDPTITTKAGALAMGYWAADDLATGLSMVWTGEHQYSHAYRGINYTSSSLGADRQTAHKIASHGELGLRLASAGAALAGSNQIAVQQMNNPLPTSPITVTPDSVVTPRGPAVQAGTPEATTALRHVQSGAPVFRQGQFGVQRTLDAQHWSLQNPGSATGFAKQMGMPTSEVDWMMGGTVKLGMPLITRPAPGIGTNLGGAMEAVVPPGGVQIEWFHIP